MKLEYYLDGFSWSQIELARQAGISEGSVRRALTGEPIARRNAQKIIAALNRKLQAQGSKEHIDMSNLTGLRIAELQRKKLAKKSDIDEAVD